VLFDKCINTYFCINDLYNSIIFQYNFEEVYITDKGNEEWYIKYKYEIPVFHLNGTFLMKHRVDEKLLEEKLSEYEMT
jgi:hypothetical protein